MTNVLQRYNFFLYVFYSLKKKKERHQTLQMSNNRTLKVRASLHEKLLP
jgi:hypothetical protein